MYLNYMLKLTTNILSLKTQYLYYASTHVITIKHKVNCWWETYVTNNK